VRRYLTTSRPRSAESILLKTSVENLFGSLVVRLVEPSGCLVAPLTTLALLITRMDILAMRYQLLVRDRRGVLPNYAILWDELQNKVRELRKEHGQSVAFELFRNGRCVLDDKQIQRYFD
jgi:hypothetical protein